VEVIAKFGGLFLEPTPQGADAGVDDVDEIVRQEAPFHPATVPQHGLGHRLAAGGHQFTDDCELERRQVDQTRRAGGVNFQGSGAEGQPERPVDRVAAAGSRATGGAAQLGGDARQQFLVADRLGQIVVGAPQQPLDLLPLSAEGGQHQGRGVGAGAASGAYPLERLQPVEPGCQTIEDEDVKGGGCGGDGGLPAVDPEHGLKTGTKQPFRDMLGQGGVVFQQQGAATGEDLVQLGERIVAVDACRFPVHGATPAFTDDTALKRNDNAQRTAFLKTRASAVRKR